MSGQEERDVLFARLFGLTAIIQSGLLVRQQALSTASHVSSSLESFVSVLSELLALGEKKSWLKESCWWSVGLAVDAVHSSVAPWKNDAISTVVKRVFIEDKTWTSEKVALYLKMQRYYPTEDWEPLLKPTFKTSDILSNKNLSALGKILKVSLSRKIPILS